MVDHLKVSDFFFLFAATGRTSPPGGDKHRWGQLSAIYSLSLLIIFVALSKSAFPWLLAPALEASISHHWMHKKGEASFCPLSSAITFAAFLCSSEEGPPWETDSGRGLSLGGKVESALLYSRRFPIFQCEPQLSWQRCCGAKLPNGCGRIGDI